MKTEWLRTLEGWCNELAKCKNPNEKEAKQIEGFIVTTAMLAAGYGWSTEEDRYVKEEI